MLIVAQVTDSRLSVIDPIRYSVRTQISENKEKLSGPSGYTRHVELWNRLFTMIFSISRRLYRKLKLWECSPESPYKWSEVCMCSTSHFAFAHTYTHTCRQLNANEGGDYQMNKLWRWTVCFNSLSSVHHVRCSICHAVLWHQCARLWNQLAVFRITISYVCTNILWANRYSSTLSPIQLYFQFSWTMTRTFLSPSFIACAWWMWAKDGRCIQSDLV